MMVVSHHSNDKYLSHINDLRIIPLGSYEPLPPSKGDF